MRARSVALVTSILISALIALGDTPLPAAEPTANAGLLPANDIVRIEAPNGTAFLKHPLIDNIRREVIASAQWKAAQSSPQVDRLRLMAQLIEKATGESWNDGLRQLTAGGIAASFSPGKSGGFTLVIAAKDAATIQRLVKTVHAFVKSRLTEEQRRHIYIPVRKDGLDYTKFGNAAYAIVGNRFLFGSNVQRLTAALGRLKSKSPDRKPSKSDALRITVDLRAVRKIPGVAKGLQVPAKNAGLVATLGGWMDLLRRGETVTAEIATGEKSLDVRVRTNSAYAQLADGLKGYFADGRTQAAAPLLQLPNAIYAASWYRDYQSLWKNRRSLVVAATAKKLEEGDDTVRQQFSVIGAKAAPSRMFSLAGPHFRVAVTRQTESDYRLKLPSRLPAAVLAVGLKDAGAFEREVIPFFRGLGLILAFEQNLQTKKSKHRDAELTTLRYADDDVSAAKGNRIRYNFATTYTIARGHFIVGTTPGIVRKTIDEIDRQAKANETPNTRATELQRINFKNAVAALSDFEWEAIRGLVLQAGFKIDAAKGELNIARNILRHLGEVTAEAGYTKDGFEYRIHIGK